MFNTDCDHWKCFDHHIFELSVSGPQARLCPVVLITGFQDVRVTLHHDPAELTPVVIVAIDHERDEGILPYVGDTLQHYTRFSLRLFIDSEVQRVSICHEADWYYVGARAGIRGGQACDPLRV